MASSMQAGSGWSRPVGLCAGVDEAGRGALAGPLSAAAVILDPKVEIPGLTDSKLLTPGRRSALSALIRKQALAWSIAAASVAEIERLNVLSATLLAMRRALEGLHLQPAFAVIDGLHCPETKIPTCALPKADATEPAVSAASILAKTERDQWLCDLDRQHPGYGFAQHKGYGVKAHLAALARLGPSSAHRRSFAPVRKALAEAGRPPEGLFPPASASRTR